MHSLDDAVVTGALFHPRRAQPGGSRLPDVFDGQLPSADANIYLGYRFYTGEAGMPVILYFHGNGEIAADYDGIAPLFAEQGAALLVVDYRGYGWSGGSPLASKLLPDAEAVLAGLTPLLRATAHSGDPLYLMGRSLGSAPAVHLALTAPQAFTGLILESAFAEGPSLLRRMGIDVTRFPPEALHNMPLFNARKLAQVDLPLLILHGERDDLIPLSEGQRLYEAAQTQHKTFVRIPRAGHNDLLLAGFDAYFGAVRAFITPG